MAETIKTPVTLAGRLNRYKPYQAVNIIRELCTQLEGDSDSFHGGIWPGNIRLDPHKTAILGSSIDTPVSQRPADEVEFLAPEYFWDGTKSASADVYSLALLLYAMCNRGRMPFQPKNKTLTDADRSAALRRRMKGETVPVTGKISRSLKDILIKALSYDPEKRYISAAEFLSALSETEEAQPPVEEDAASVPAAPKTEESPAPVAEEAVGETVEEPSESPAAPVMEDLPAVPTEETPAEEAVPAEDPLPEEPVAVAEADELTKTPDAVELPVPEPEEALDKTPDAEPVPAAPEAEVAPKAEPERRKYTVQKDFEEALPRNRTNSIPASRRKKKVSPIVPVLCILAVGIILVVVLTMALGTVKDNSNESPEPTSQPYVITPSEVEAENSGDKPEDAETASQPEEETTPEENETEEADTTESDANLGSSTIDGMTVEAANDVVYVTQSGAKLRSGPSTSYDVADSLSRDTELLRTGIVNGWSQVQYNGTEYYISNALISAETADSSGTDTTISSGNGIGTLEISSEANVRAGAGTGYDVLGIARVGTTLTITDVTDDGKWYQVSFNGQTGYINRNMVTVKEMDYSASARVTGDVNVRSGPGTNYSKLGVAKAGETLTVTGITGGNWYQISFNGETGYVAGNFISIQ